jgi:hypothetical protein
MGEDQVHELALLDRAGQALAEARSFDEIKEIRNKAEAVRKYAQSASLGLDIQNRAAEVKLRAERQAGKLLSAISLRGGDRRSKNHGERLKLDDLGISRNQSTRWQLEARVPEDVFREYIRETRQAGRELTSNRLIRLAKLWSQSTNGRRDNGNGHARRKNGSSSVTRRQIGDVGSSDIDMAETISELINHYQLMDSILRPIYSGESTTLLAEERRVLRYLLLESQQMITRMDKLQHCTTKCACGNGRPPQ